MSITINGTGTITGISAGGLPDGSITNDDLAGSITDAKLSGTTCKAWVNFNGQGTVAIRASYNVSSITDNGTGDYTVNFTNALADANYAAGAIGVLDESGSAAIVSSVNVSRTAGQNAGSFRLQTYYWASSSNNIADYAKVLLTFFR